MQSRQTWLVRPLLWYGGTYLWKTDTQLSSPLAHLALYSSNLGLTDSRNGPMKGILKNGPAREPFWWMYMTVTVSEPKVWHQTYTDHIRRRGRAA
jgi:hypothetical protein